MRIVSPRFAAGHPDRELQCEGVMGAVVDEVLHAAMLRGWEAPEVLMALTVAINDLDLVAAEPTVASDTAPKS